MNATGFAVPERIADLMRGMMADIRAAEIEIARRDPETHRLTRFMEGTTGSVYWIARPKRRGSRVELRYARSKGPNVAGYYLAWRERVTADGTIKRDRFTGHKSKQVASDWCRARCIDERDAKRRDAA